MNYEPREDLTSANPLIPQTPLDGVVFYTSVPAFQLCFGYIGHLASRHSELLSDSSPVLTNNQVEAMKVTSQQLHLPEVKEEPDPELSIPTSTVPNYQTTVTKETATKSTETRRLYRNSKGEQPNNQIEWEEKRSREEKLVADIIDRVRRECEAQGSGRAARRGYTRRTTIMNT